MAKTNIQWSEWTWNPIMGCSIISSGCRQCYAMKMAARLERMGVDSYRGLTTQTKGGPVWTGEVRLARQEIIEMPLRWRKPRRVFVNSMSDLFHKDIPESHIAAVFDTMESADWHIYQVLTKRSSLLMKFVNNRYSARPAPPHIWLGVSVENEQATSRIAHLQKANVCVRFLSIEPLIAPVGRLDLQGINWVIVGGESGPGARPMNSEWAIDVRDQCVSAGVAFFFKQWGGRSPKTGGRLLEGREWSQFPAAFTRSQVSAQDLFGQLL